MSSDAFCRRWGVFFLLAAILPVLSGCGIRIGETPGDTPPIALSTSEIGCLEPAPRVLKKYLDGAARVEEVEKVFDCALGAIETFATQTRGANRGFYTRSELENFLGRYFLNGRQWDSEVYQSLFEFKAALIGGSLESLTRRELNVARDLVRVLKDQTLRLKPLMPLDRLRNSKLGFGDLNEAADLFADIGLTIGQFLERNSEGYSFSQMDRALTQLENLLPEMSLDRYRELIELFRIWKEVFVSSSRDVITRQDWPRVFSESARWYFLFAKYERFVEQPSAYLCGEGRRLTVGLLKESISIVERSLALKGVTEIPFSELDRIVDKIPFSGKGLQGETLKDALRKIAINVLRNTRTRDLTAARVATYRHRLLESSDPSLKVSDLKKLGVLIAEWDLGQAYVESLFVEKNRSCQSGVRWDRQFGDLIVSSKEINDGAERFIVSQRLRGIAAKTVKDVASFLIDSAALWQPAQGKILLGKEDRSSYSFLELSARNTLKVLLEAIYEGYGAERQSDGRVNRITKSELNQFYLDVRNAGIEIKLVDPRLWDWADNRFREANIFTLIGDGDDYISLRELRDLVLELVSVRLMSLEMLAESSRICPILGKDIFDFDIIEEKCFFEFLKARLASEVMGAPNWVKFYQALPEDQKDSMLAMMRSMILPQTWDGVENALMDVWAGIFHFEELMFERYDLDRSGGLDVQEAEVAFPQFRALLREISGLEDDEDLFAVMTYVLAKGEIPTKDVAGMSAFVWWKLKKPFWDFHADRSYVMKVFNAISSPPFLEK